MASHNQPQTATESSQEGTPQPVGTSSARIPDIPEDLTLPIINAIAAGGDVDELTAQLRAEIALYTAENGWSPEDGVRAADAYIDSMLDALNVGELYSFTLDSAEQAYRDELQREGEIETQQVAPEENLVARMADGEQLQNAVTELIRAAAEEVNTDGLTDEQIEGASERFIQDFQLGMADGLSPEEAMAVALEGFRGEVELSLSQAVEIDPGDQLIAALADGGSGEDAQQALEEAARAAGLDGEGAGLETFMAGVEGALASGQSADAAIESGRELNAIEQQAAAEQAVELSAADRLMNALAEGGQLEQIMNQLAGGEAGDSFAENLEQSLAGGEALGDAVTQAQVAEQIAREQTQQQSVPVDPADQLAAALAGGDAGAVGDGELAETLTQALAGGSDPVEALNEAQQAVQAQQAQQQSQEVPVSAADQLAAALAGGDVGGVGGGEGGEAFAEELVANLAAGENVDQAVDQANQAQQQQAQAEQEQTVAGDPVASALATGGNEGGGVTEEQVAAASEGESTGGAGSDSGGGGAGEPIVVAQAETGTDSTDVGGTDTGDSGSTETESTETDDGGDAGTSETTDGGTTDSADSTDSTDSSETGTSDTGGNETSESTDTGTTDSGTSDETGTTETAGGTDTGETGSTGSGSGDPDPGPETAVASGGDTGGGGTETGGTGEGATTTAAADDAGTSGGSSSDTSTGGGTESSGTGTGSTTTAAADDTDTSGGGGTGTSTDGGTDTGGTGTGTTTTAAVDDTGVTGGTGSGTSTGSGTGGTTSGGTSTSPPATYASSGGGTTTTTSTGGSSSGTSTSTGGTTGTGGGSTGGTTTSTPDPTPDPDPDPVNLAPSLSGGATQAFVENAGAINVTSALSLSDSDNSNLASATVSISGGFVASEDVLAVNTGSTGINASYDSASGVLTLSGSAAVGSYQQVLQSLTYDNSSNNPTTSTRTITVSVSDGLLSASQNWQVTISQDNDAPTGADSSISGTEDTAIALATSHFGFSDLDTGDSLAGVRIDSLPTAGTLTLAGNAVAAGQVVTVADINAGNLSFSPAANGVGSPYSTFTFSVQDSAGAFDLSSRTLSVNITGVDDAPTGSDTALNGTEDTALVLNAGSFSFADVDGDTLAAVRIDSLPGVGGITLSGNPVAAGQVIAIADINAGSLSFSPAANASGAPYANFTFSVQDSTGTFDASSRTLTINISAVNDAPTSADAVVGGTEDTALVLNVGLFSFADIDGDTLAAVRIDSLPAAGVVNLSGNPVTAGQVIAIADINAGNLSFTPAADGFGSPYTTLGFSVQDSGGAFDATSRTLSINITGTNDAPVVAANATLADVLEDSAGNPGESIANLFAASFNDSADGTSANTLAGIAITGYTRDAAKGEWQFSTDGGTSWTNIAASIANDTVAQLYNANTKLRFEPTANFNGAAPSLTARLIETGTANIGNGDALITDAEVTDLTGTTGGVERVSGNNLILGTNVTSVNDAPQLFVGTIAAFFTENGAAQAVFGGASFLVSANEVDTALTELVLTVTNVQDGADEILSIDGSNVALTNGNAVTTATNTMSVSVALAGTTATVTISNTAGITEAAMATLIDGIRYSNTSENPTAAGIRNINIASIKDVGGTANGGLDSSTPNQAGTVAITPVNDAPTLTSFAAVLDTTNEDTEVEITFAELTAQGDEADVDGTIASFEVQAVSSGTLKIGANAGAATAFNATTNNTINATNKAYWTPDANAGGTLNAFTVKAKDNGGLLSSTSIQTTVTVNALNDDPQVTPTTVNAVDFDGASGHVKINDHVSLDGFTGGMSVEAWINPDVVTGTRFIASKLASTGDQRSWQLYLSGNKLVLETTSDGTNGTSVAVTSATSLVAGQWTHVAGTYDGATLGLFINGTQDANTAAQTGNVFASTAPMAIGGRYLDGVSAEASTLFDGKIRDVRVWSDARTSAELVEFSNHDAVGETGLVAQYRLTDVNLTATDSGGSSINGTYQGGAEPAAPFTGTDNSDIPITGLLISDADSAAGNITVTLAVGAGTITVNTGVGGGLGVGNVTNNGTASVTLTGTVAQIAATLADATGVLYRNTTAGDQTLTVTVNDGGNTGTGGGGNIVRTYGIDVEDAGFFPGNGLEFDGTNDVVETGKGTGNNLFITGDLTMETWFRTDVIPVGDNNELIAYADTNGDPQDRNTQYLMGINTAGQLFYTHEYGAGNNVDLNFTNAVVQTGQWYHAAMVRDATARTVTLYLNGRDMGSLTYGAGEVADGGSHASVSLDLGGISSEGTGEFAHDGAMDEIRIWNDQRTAAEILANYNRQISPSEANLVSYYRADEATGTELHDLTGNQHGTLLYGASFGASGAETHGTDIQTEKGQTVTGSVLETDPQTNYAFSIVTQPTQGTVSINATTGVWSYTARSDYGGSDSFTVQAFDGTTNFLKTFTVQVDPDAPAMSSGGLAQAVNDNATLQPFDNNDGSGLDSVISDIDSTSLDTKVRLFNTKDLVGQWSFSGNANDMVGSNNGTVSGASLVADRHGNANSAYFFDGTDDTISFPDSAALQPTTAFTIAMWVNAADLTGIKRLITKFPNTGGVAGEIIVSANNGQLDFAIYKSDNSIFNLSSGLTDLTVNTWHHVAVTFDGGAMRIIVDGASRAPGALGEVSIVDSASTWVLGEDSVNPGAASEYWHGAIDDLRIYHRALDDTELSQIAFGVAGELTSASLAASGFSYLGDDTYELTGQTPANATSKLQALVLDPRDDLLTTGDNQEVVLSVDVSDGGQTSRHHNTSVTINGINDAPVVTSVDATVRFDGNDSYAKLPTLTGASLSGAYSLEAWFYFEDHQANQRIVDLGNGTQKDNLLIFVNADDNKLYFDTYGGETLSSLSTNTSLVSGRWYHVAGVNDGNGNAHLYLNGVLDNSSNAMQTAQNVDRDESYIAHSNWFGFGAERGFKGQIRDVRIWNDARDGNEIQQFLGKSVTGENNLVAWYQMNETSGTTLTDSSGNALNGTYFGDVTFTTPFVDFADDTIGLGGIVISDPDAAGAVTATFTVTGGTLTISTVIANGITAATNNGTASVSVSGTIEQIQETLNDPTGLVFNPPAGGTGVFTLTVNVNDGTANTNGTRTITVEPKSMEMGNAIEFDGTDDYVVVADNNLLDLANNWTIELWVFADGNSTMNLIERGVVGADTAGGYNIEIAGTNVNYETSNNDGNGSGSRVGALTANAWNHVALTFDNGTASVYVNGAEAGIADMGRTAPSNLAAPLMIGRRGEGADPRWFDGKLDDIRIWNVTRTAEEIESHFERALTGHEAGLVAYYRADETSGTQLEDLSGNGLTGTLTNGPTFATGFNATTGHALAAEEIEVVRNGSVTGFVDMNDDGAKVYALASNGGNGNVTLDGNTGEWTYTPNANFSGNDSFAITYSGGGGANATRQYEVEVGIGNAPVASDIRTGNNQAATFDGAGDYLTRGAHDTAFDLPQYTLEAWIRPDALTGDNPIMGNINIGLDQGFWLDLQTNGQLRLITGASNGSDDIHVISTTDFDAPNILGQWTHVAASFDGISGHIFVNGVLETSVNRSTTGLDHVTYDAARSFTIGATSGVGTAAHGDNRFFDGAIDNVRVWDTARSATDIARDMTKVLSGSEDGLVAAYQMDGSGTTYADITGNGHDLTAQGNTARTDLINVSVASGSTYKGLILGGDGTEGDGLAYTEVADAQNKATVNANGTFEYDASGLGAGAYNFTVDISDGTTSFTETVNVTVT